MTKALQNRLVGTVIIVALIVIFVPYLFDGEKQISVQNFSDIPPIKTASVLVQPDRFPDKEIAEATQRPIEVIDEQAIDNIYENAENNLEKDASTETIIQDNNAVASNTSGKETKSNDKNSSVSSNVDDNSLASQTVVERTPSDQREDSGWVIQLGSFQHQKNVKDLLKKLESSGYRAFSRPVNTSAGLLTKVFVGPELDKEKLRLALPHLKQQTGLKGKVTTFEVIPK